jgi:hypothetical protein
MKNNQKTTIKIPIDKLKLFFNRLLVNFTLAKFISALLTITIMATIKYWYWGNLDIDHSNFLKNLSTGLLAWTINNGIVGWLSDYWNIKGINWNLKEFIHGKELMEVGGKAEQDRKGYLSDFKRPLSLAMDSKDEHNPSNNSNTSASQGYTEDVDSMDIDDKEKDIDRSNHPINIVPEQNSVPDLSKWSRAIPGLDQASVLHPKIVNPGPGFNVPGGVVPIQDDICKHIDYNTNILRQFKNMDLKTATEQRDNYLKFIYRIDHKTRYAQDTLLKLPEIPRNESEYHLKNKILSDLAELAFQREQSQGKIILLNSRIEFIQIHKKPDE